MSLFQVPSLFFTFLSYYQSVPLTLISGWLGSLLLDSEEHYRQILNRLIRLHLHIISEVNHAATHANSMSDGVTSHTMN